MQVWEVVRMTQTANAAPARLYSVTEAADQLRVSRWKLYELMRTGQLAYVQSTARSGNPGYRKVEETEIQRYLADNRVTP